MPGGYSIRWFETFADTIPPEIAAAEIEDIMRCLPIPSFHRVLDVGCGTGRVAAPLIEHGYTVTGVDVNIDALRRARHRAPGLRCVALDQRDIGSLKSGFDAALILWNSIGYGSAHDDLRTLRGVHHVLRPGGRLIVDLYHPEWLAANSSGTRIDTRGATIRRWVQDGRCCHRIEYDAGGVDEMAFRVYAPKEFKEVLRQVGFTESQLLVRWQEAAKASSKVARYQMVAARAPQ
jgi:SAM-dependent methyltransferase